VLQRRAAPYLKAVHDRYEATGHWQRQFAETSYRARTWPQPRRVVIKAEVTVNHKGEPRDNPRFVVTSLSLPQAQQLYEHYGDRGEMENRIKGTQKTNSRLTAPAVTASWPISCAVLLHAAAFVLHCELRRALHDTELAQAQVETLQRKLLKLGVRVQETARRIWLALLHELSAAKRYGPLLLERLRAAPS